MNGILLKKKISYTFQWYLKTLSEQMVLKVADCPHSGASNQYVLGLLSLPTGNLTRVLVI